jgi:hypothetical protein
VSVPGILYRSASFAGLNGARDSLENRGVRCHQPAQNSSMVWHRSPRLTFPAVSPSSARLRPACRARRGCDGISRTTDVSFRPCDVAQTVVRGRHDPAATVVRAGPRVEVLDSAPNARPVAAILRAGSDDPYAQPLHAVGSCRPQRADQGSSRRLLTGDDDRQAVHGPLAERLEAATDSNPTRAPRARCLLSSGGNRVTRQSPLRRSPRGTLLLPRP